MFIPEGVEPPDRSIIAQPELAIYYEGFGSGLADNCLNAEVNGKVVGAVWTRIMKDYGCVDDYTPSVYSAIDIELSVPLIYNEHVAGRPRYITP